MSPGASVQLWCYDGSEWVRVACDADGILRVDTKHLEITQLRITAVGLKVSGVCYVHWITFNPSAKASVAILTDSLTAGGTPAWAFERESLDSDHLLFEPAFKFSTGLYVETFTNMTDIFIAYDTG